LHPEQSRIWGKKQQFHGGIPVAAAAMSFQKHSIALALWKFNIAMENVAFLNIGRHVYITYIIFNNPYIGNGGNCP
jgi:hypothetical protein